MGSIILKRDYSLFVVEDVNPLTVDLDLDEIQLIIELKILLCDLAFNWYHQSTILITLGILVNRNE